MPPNTPRAGLEFDPSDPVQVAVKLTKLEGALAAAQQAFSQTANNLTQSMGALQTEVRAVADQVRDLAKISHKQDGHEAGLNRAFEAIRDLARETTRRFSDQAEDLEGWRSKYEAERDLWRSNHEADNRKTREKLILWNGVGLGFSMLSTVLVALLTYVYLGDKQVAADDRARIERQSYENHIRFERLDEQHSNAIRALEREVARLQQAQQRQAAER